MESMQLGFSFSPGMGGCALTEPVATMMASAVISSTEPSDFFTDSFLEPVNFASPSTRVTLLALQQGGDAGGQLLGRCRFYVR